MAQASRETLEFTDLSKGLNTFDPETKVPAGYYVDAQNMVLTNKSPVTIGGTTRLNTTAAPDGRVVLWFEPYTELDGMVYFICFLNAGNNIDGDGPGIWKYEPTGDDWTPVWVAVGNNGTGTFGSWSDTMINTNNRLTVPITSIPYRGTLILTPNATSTLTSLVNFAIHQSGAFPEFPLKWDGTAAVPLGAFAGSPEITSGIGTAVTQIVATFDSDEVTWTGGASEVAGGERKQGDGSRSLTGAASMNLVYAADRNFLTGLSGAPDLTTTDLFMCWIKRTAGTGTFDLTVRMGNDADSAYFEEVINVPDIGNNVWHGISALRSGFAATGAPVWSVISKLTLTQTGAGNTVLYDAAYFYYAVDLTFVGHGPVLDVYQEQLVVGAPRTTSNAIVYSDVGSPDYFDAANIARFSGGRSALESKDVVTALWSYFDELIVGKPTSAWTFSGTGTNVSVSALPLTIGIGGTRAIAETPWSLHYYYDNNIFGARLTSRGLVSTNISSLLADVDNTALDAVVSIRDDSSHTVRWSFPTDDSDGNDLGLIYDYQLDAWASMYTPKIRHYTKWINTTNSQRELLGCVFDVSS